MRLLLVGNSETFHVGYHIACAARSLGWTCTVQDSRTAYRSKLWQKILWRIDRIPVRIAGFEKEVLNAARQFKPDLVLTTGIAPLRRTALEELAGLSCGVANFSTDDPWNRQHRCRWFLNALPSYDFVFTPRHANISEFQSRCTRKKTSVSQLHFGYNPEVHFVEPNLEPGRNCDVLIVGGADSDRIPYAASLTAVGLQVTAYGGYWQQTGISGLKAAGHADVTELRKATRSAKTNLILVRRANRDGHVMRTFEAWASGGCLLVEDTQDHRAIFGAEGEKALYFKTSAEAAQKAGFLTSNPSQRKKLLDNLNNESSLAMHTYAERLRAVERSILNNSRFLQSQTSNKFGKGVRSVFA